MPKYTFLLPAYKARFFREALESIASQTYKDFKVFISDDCSPENLYSIAQPFLNDDRFIYRRNEKNIGAKRLVKHWNQLLDDCETEFAIFASDDDVYDKDYLFELDKLIETHPDSDVYRPLIRNIDEKGDIIREEKFVGAKLSLGEFVMEWGQWQIFSGFPYYVFRTSPLKSKGGVTYFDYAFFSDDITVMKSIADSGIRVVDRVLFSMRISDCSISSTLPESIKRTNIKTATRVYHFINTLDVPEVCKPIALKRIQSIIKSYFEFSKVSVSLLVYLFCFCDFRLLTLQVRVYLIKRQIIERRRDSCL